MKFDSLRIKIGDYVPYRCRVYAEEGYNCIAMVYWTDEGEITSKVVKCETYPEKVGLCLDSVWGHPYEKPYEASKEEMDYWIKYVKFMDI
jgi:hypothetical protein